MTNTEIVAASKIMLGTTEAIAMYIGSTLIWQQGGSSVVHDYSQDYFTIESLEDNNTISIKTMGSNSYNPNVYYSTDDGETWNNKTLTGGTNTIAIINTGDAIIFKCTINQWGTSWDKYYYFDGSKTFKTYGNIMSLLNGDNFVSNSEFAVNSTHNFAGLFRTTNIIDANNLILPAKTLYNSSYNGMFRGATNLVNGPKLLPALDVPTDAYSSMFEGCVKLTEGPEIVATTVSGDTALNRMFCMNRNSKVTAAMTKSPVLRITNPLAYSNVYQQLFCGNGNITEVTILAQATNLTFSNWLNYTNTGGVIKTLSGTTFSSGVSGLPSGWTTQEYSE